MRLVRKDGGWQMSSFADDSQVMTVKSKDFKTGNGATTGDTPLILSFEPIDEPVATDDPLRDACSKFYRIRCDEGYLATNKTALGASILCNHGPHDEHGIWILVDQTVLDELIVEGIETPVADEASSLFPSTSSLNYDLQGRRVTDSNGGLYIQNGKKIIR